MLDEQGGAHLLIVEDEEILLDILTDTLVADGFQVHAVTTGAAAREQIAVQAGRFDAILLDRLLPDMDALALLPEIKSNPLLAHVPVVIQTGVTGADEITAGLNAGAYYYLTKPFPPETLLSIVRAAVHDRRQYLDLQGRIQNTQGAVRHLDRGEFSFRTQAEARDLAALAAHAAPDPNRVALGLTELMLNAVEHGNLGISYAEKSRLIARDQLAAEVERRLADPALGARQARLVVERSETVLRYTVQDEGTGFDWQPYLEIAPERAFDTHGRGIAMSRMLSFDALDYHGCGNIVVGRVSLTPFS